MSRFTSLVCPVCQHPLRANGQVWRCGAGHSFDLAKEGYLNLLLAHKKRSSDPGDNQDMLQRRRQFLQAGYYEPLVQAITGVLQTKLPVSTEAEALDLGCGEGYYTAQLRQRLGSAIARWNGLDISRSGVRMAARCYPECDFVVGSSFALPYANDSQSLACRIFAPANDAEVRRVLRAGGLYLVVNPGPQHLLGLKAALYEQPRSHEAVTLVANGFELLTQQIVTAKIVVGGEALQSLFTMTPFFWNVGVERSAQLAHLDCLETAIEFHLALYRAA